jgi:hypothetical protein
MRTIRTTDPTSTETSCRLARAAFAGFTGGYLMALAGYWLEAVLGVSDLDFAHAGLRYVSGGKEGWWVVGIIFHFIDSTLLGIFYAAVVYRRLRWLEDRYGLLWGNLAAGVGFGLAVWLVLAMLIAMPFLGAGVFGWNTGSARPAVASLSVHLVFGSLVGLIYGHRTCTGAVPARPDRWPA